MEKRKLLFTKPAFKTLLFSLLLLSTEFAYANQSQIDAEVGNYIELFNGDNFSKQRKAIDSLSWAGISDPILYDLIERKLLDLYQSDDKMSEEYAAWYAKTLAFSGNRKYVVTLENVIDTGSRKIAKHAKTGLERLSQYVIWNPIISANLISAPEGRLEESRVNNMLNSNLPALAIIGAKRVYYAHSDDDLLVGVAAQVLQDRYQTASSDEETDQIAWLIKALAQTGDRSYRPLLEKIADDATERKIAKYAKKYMEYL